MKTKLFHFVFFIILVNCAEAVDYSEEHIDQTSGRYLYHQDDIIDVYYENNKLFLKWRGAEKIKPVAFDENVFFVADMYTKLRFLKHPASNNQFIGIVSKENEDSISYDYAKVADDFKTPSMHLKDKDYKMAYEGFSAIIKKDSTSNLVDEWTFNRMGYDFLRDRNYEDAIEVFKMNVALYPKSSNVYDSLADAYLRSGDSLQAFNNYKKALEFNNDNKRAKEYVNAYNSK